MPNPARTLSLVAIAASVPVSVVHAQDACVVDVQEVVAESGDPAGFYGIHVALDGGTAAVGASDNNDTIKNGGAVFVYGRASEVWRFSKRIEPVGVEASDFFGFSVSVSGDLLVGGAWGEDTNGSLAGAAYAFRRDEGGAEQWGQIAELLSPTGSPSDLFGLEVFVEGDTIFVGAPLDGFGGVANAGSVSVYQIDEVSRLPVFLKQLGAPDANQDAGFGTSIASEGSVVVVGSPSANAQGNGAGAAYVFRRDLGGTDNWGFEQKLTGSDVDANDQFGSEVAVDGDRIVVGARKRDRNGVFSGAAFVFDRDAGTGVWSESDSFTSPEPDNLEEFGISVALQGDRIVVGALRTDLEDEGGVELPECGTVHVFDRDPGTGDWASSLVVMQEPVSGGALFGSSVAFDGDWVFAGARGDGEVPFTGSASFLELGTGCDEVCVADFSEPFGVLNFFDLGGFLTAFNAQDPRADLAAPMGSWNFFDLGAFLQAFNEGCP